MDFPHHLQAYDNLGGLHEKPEGDNFLQNYSGQTYSSIYLDLLQLYLIQGQTYLYWHIQPFIQSLYPIT